MGIKLGRNADCYCGSGKKFKNCCLARPPASAENPAGHNYRTRSVSAQPCASLSSEYLALVALAASALRARRR